MRYYVTISGVERLVDVEATGPGRYRVRSVDESGSAQGLVDYVELAEAEATLIATSGERRFWVADGSGRGRFEILSRATRTQVSVVSERERVSERVRKAKRTRSGASAITAPMPGRIVRVLVDVGARVEAGQALVAIEAMKMQNELSAERAGVVGLVLVKAGDSVEAGAELVRLTEIGAAT